MTILNTIYSFAKERLTAFTLFFRVNIIGGIFLTKENWAPAILVTNAVLFSALFVNDYTSKESFGKRKSIGSIVFKKNSVQRKFDNRIVWSSLDLNNLISNKDSIKTDALADAIIKLNDGTEIHIDENSMIFLDFSGFNPVLNFKEGSVKIKKSTDKSFFSSNLIVQSGDKQVEIGKSDIKLKKSSDDLAVFVEKGNATVTSGNNSQKITEGMTAELNKNNIQSKKISLSLNSPPDKIRIIDSGETADVDFSWNGNGKGNVTLEVSRSSKFSKIFLKSNTSDDKQRLSLPEGTYYWRVSSYSDGVEEHSESRKLIIITDSAIKILSPRNKENYFYVENLPSVDFLWNKRYLSSGYTLLVSKTADFKEKTEIYETDSNSFTIPNVKEGNYFWKVISKSELTDIPIRNSSVFQFSISKKEAPPPVALKTPLNEHKFESENLEEILLEWNDNGSDEYQIQISQTPDFNSILVDKKLNRTSYRFKKTAKVGVFYWRVKNLEAGGNFSRSFSFMIPEKPKVEETQKRETLQEEKTETVKEKEKPKSLEPDETLVLTKPLDNQVFEFTGLKAVVLEWKSNVSKESQIQISEYYDFRTNIIDVITKEKSFKFEKFLSGKHYYWRVKIFGKREYTKPFGFIIKDVVSDTGPQIKPRRPTKESDKEREQRRKIELDKFNEYLKL